MNIGIIGAGNIGASLAKLLTEAGHRVMLSNSRGPESLQGLIRELGEEVQAGTAEEAAVFGEIVIEAIPFASYKDLPKAALGSKIFISASNYYPNRDGEIALNGKSETELIADYLSEARVVKAFNTIYFKHLQEQGDASKAVDERRVIFIAGDDQDAKQRVKQLIEEIGFGAVDTGSLRDSKVQQPGTEIYNRDMTVGEARRFIADSHP